MSWLGGAAEALFDCLFPRSCAACSAVGFSPFCPPCEAALEPAPSAELPGFSRVVIPYRYGGPASLAVQALKFDGRIELGPLLGARIAAELGGGFDLVVPVPLPRRRLAERGYNQARELARGLPVPVRPLALARTRTPRPQVGLSRPERHRNQHGSFAATEGVRGRRVLLLDDVLTTGATAQAAGEALLAAGAAEVGFAAFARAEDGEA